MLRVIQSRMLPRLFVFVLSAVLAVLPLGAPCSAQAADALQDTTSLAFVPDDVAFYAAGLRMREVYDKIATSQAIAKLQQLPIVQSGWNMVLTRWQDPQLPQLAALKMAVEQPANQQLLAMLKDAVSQELFVYGGADFGDALALIDEINAASQAAQMEALANGEFDDIQAAQFSRVLEVLNSKGDQLTVPVLMIGAKLSDPEAATAQIKRLEEWLTATVMGMQERVTREKIGNAEFLTLRLDGSLVPWPLILQHAQGVDPEQVQQMMTRLSTIQLVISIGVRDKYLIVSLGADNKHLAQLGQGSLLYSRSEMAPLRKATDKAIIQVSYASAAFTAQASGVEGQIDQLSALISQVLPMAGLSEELEEELAADLDKMTEYLQTKAVQPGAQSAYSYLTPEGVETFAYSWTTESALDASKNLTILNYVGGDPIAFWAARGKSDPEQLDVLVQLVSRAVYYAERILAENGDLGQREAFEKLREELQPYFAQLAQVTQDKLLPAFADGQIALVLDAKSTSPAWHAAMPPSDTALPMLEIGMAMGVSDAGLVRSAFSDYLRIAQQIWDKLHELSVGELEDAFPQEIPARTLTKPQSKDISGGTVYYYPLPAETGLDAQLALNAGLSNRVMVTSYLPRFTARLIADTSLQGQGPLANINRPLAAAGHLDFARLIAALQPWIDYGLKLQQDQDLDAEPDDEDPMGDISQQVHDVLEVLQCFQGIYLVTYEEDNAMVTHSQCRFTDLP